MAYYNNTSNANFYPIPSTSGEFDVYPFLSQTPANEEANGVTSNTFVDGWGMHRQPDYTVGSPRSLQVDTGFGKHDCSLLDVDAYA